jgi:(1->4)-alpha-D-glucan 1-alpha-D-glucosylmutase
VTNPAGVTGSVSSTPTATYRLQLRAGFGLREAARLVPYLARLGVSHVYCSSYLRARAGSPHGYDITDHATLNPEVGDDADFAAFVATLRAHDMGQILDFVPNHMGIGQADNAWWLDVLEYGEASSRAGFFDIDWHPAKRELRGKVLVPFLGDHYGRVLEREELRLAFDSDRGSFFVAYHQHRFPIGPRSVARLLDSLRPQLRERLAADHPAAIAFERVLADLAAGPTAAMSPRRSAEAREGCERAKRELARLTSAEPALRELVEAAVAACKGEAGRPESFRALHRLLEAQSYRLAFWRVAADEINYRRFFNINELAGLRIERRDVFDLVHRRALEWIGRGELDGLRIDHIDGLLDPRAYCERLREAVGDRPLYLVVEKILAHHEALRDSWPVQGSTGYEFLNELGGLFVDPAGEAELERSWRRRAPEAPAFDDELYACKKHVMNFLLGGELQVLANDLDRLSESDRSTRDFTQTALREALKEVVACFPVYRSYVDAEGATDEDRRDIDWAIAQARRRSSDPEPTLFDWIHEVLTTDLGRESGSGSSQGRPPGSPGAGVRRHDVVRFAMHFQQFTGPVMAKALEDTSFYRQHRLVSLNEVGGDPRRFGNSVAAFHRANALRLRRWPHAMLTTSTHDTKRGEDTRLRIHTLSEVASEWESRVLRWETWNVRFKRVVGDAPAPASEDEYLLYQTLVGTWPELDGARPDPAAAWLPAYRERLEAYAIKALREAKRRSSWRYPHADYEQALLAFLAAILDPGRAAGFLADLAELVARVAPIAALHGLSQTVLKLAVPGVPDVYQGCELWDLTLADPDNRRPVDWALRSSALAAIDAELAGDPDRAGAALDALLDDWRDGRAKLLVTSRLLGLRRRLPGLLRDGEYLPLAVSGARADRVVAFARRAGADWLLVVAPRLVAPLLPESAGLRIPPLAWQDTRVRLPEGDLPRRWRDVVTGAESELESRGGALEIGLATALARIPVGVLRSQPA